MRKREIAIHQSVADSLTRAGLGTYSFTIAEQQINPATGKPLSGDSPFVIVTYSGLEDDRRLWRLVSNAKVAQRSAERAGKPQEGIERAVQTEIQEGVDRELVSKAHIRALLGSLSKSSGQ